MRYSKNLLIEAAVMLAVAAATCAHAASESAAAPVNVLLIVSEDTGLHLGCS